MASNDRIRTARTIRAAEGYLELNLPQYALETLDRLPRGHMPSRALYLKGEALRSLQRFDAAIEPLLQAAELDPEDVRVWLALGWCYKRTSRLDQAIDALEHALAADSSEAVVPYNLACYWSLAGNKQRALEYLSTALALNGDFRDLVGEESDFDTLRDDPDFQALVSVIV
ncbi:MAG: tetratricopeptide repeat protein [Pirellulales bacterium]|nr:tetratricopeptide repeat protein [Pirellulales bacterium]